MWKVKRMNTAGIVVLTIAVGAGGIAACLAGGSDSKPPPAAPVAKLQTVDVLVAKSDSGLGKTATPELKPGQTSPFPAAHQAGTLSLALHSVADVDAADIGSEDQARWRGNINAVRYGITNPTTIQK